MSKRSSSGKDRWDAPIKVAALVVALGLIMLAIESPRLIAGGTDATAKSSSMQASEESGAPGLPASASEYYVPAQFPAPKGEVEAQPPTF